MTSGSPVQGAWRGPECPDCSPYGDLGKPRAGRGMAVTSVGGDNDHMMLLEAVAVIGLLALVVFTGALWFM